MTDTLKTLRSKPVKTLDFEREKYILILVEIFEKAEHSEKKI